MGGRILLLHGAAGPGSLDSLRDHLAASHRVLAPLHPGWNGTARPAHLDSVAALAATYLELLDEQQLTGVTVVGVSFGGWVAAEMAVADGGQRIDRLVLIDAVGPHIPGHSPTMPSGPPPPRNAGHGPPPGNLAALRAYTGETWEDPTLLDRVGTLAIPALLVWGEHDAVVSPDFGRRYAGAIPGARFALVPGGGHLPMREAPDATFAALDAFLTKE